MDKIGRIEDGKITREWYGQGYVFKDWDAFYNRPDDPCYVAEYSDTIYTRNDFLEMTDGHVDLAEQIFEFVDWQSPWTVFDEWKLEQELFAEFM